MICQDCGAEYEKWLPDEAIENNRCLDCNAERWQEWEQEEADNLAQIAILQNQGHSHHCACRQVWGDGECECDMYEKGYDPYVWMKNLTSHSSGR